MASDHADLICFGGTLQENFPLILVVGKDANGVTGTPVSHRIDPYDWREFPRCTFWNNSYDWIARVKESTRAELRNLCLCKKASPIVYADLLPVCIKGGDIERQKILAGLCVDRGMVTKHINDLLSHELLKARLKVVILAAGARPKGVYKLAAETLRNGLSRDVPVFGMTPFGQRRWPNSAERKAMEELRAPGCELARTAILEALGKFGL